MRIPSIFILTSLCISFSAGDDLSRRNDPARIQLEIRLFEIKSVQNQAVGYDWTIADTLPSDRDANSTPANTSQPNGTVATITGILTDPQFRTVIRALENREGAVPLIAAQVPAVSGAPVRLQRPDGWQIKIMPKVSGDEIELEFEISQNKGEYAGYTFSSTARVPNGQAAVFSDLLPGTGKKNKKPAQRLTLILDPKLN